MTIMFEDHGHRGRYVLRKDGHEAELSVSKMSDALWIVDHTGVPDALGGQGIGKILAEHAVSNARANGRILRASCPFFLAQAARHPEWAGVVKR